MAITSMKRVHVPYFCEGCGKETFEGVVFGREVSRQVSASSGDRSMWCEDCRPTVKIPDLTSKLSSFFTRPGE